MLPPILLLWMIFCHVVDDYYLQGCLAQLKQRKYWEDNAPDEMYKHDYIVALICHAFSWAFMIMLPILIYLKLDPPSAFYIVFIFNWATHAIADDLKANKKRINLIQDQTWHLCQILYTYFIMMIFC